MLTRRHLMQILAAASLPVPNAGAGTASAADPVGGVPASEGGAPVRLGAPVPFRFETLVAEAEARLAVPYRPRPDPAPDVTRRLGYSQHNAVHQPVASGLFAAPGRDGIVTLFHLGELFRHPVRLSIVEGAVARAVLYDRRIFAYPAGSPAGLMPEDAGFAGFRIHEPWNGLSERVGDWVSFLGASYFRASGDGVQYGLSARGVALETAAFDGVWEEFPEFTDFFVEAMTGGVMTVHALLDGKSITGAFRFAIRHFPHVTMEVTAALFLRRKILRLGLAPLTSMYWYSQETRWAAGDWRPEVHDSDGLLVHERGGAALWRPLTNPPKVALSVFPVRDVAGFGLLQRDRDYRSYEDEAGFERRPNLWVEPTAGFGAGSVQLVEFPTDSEYGDNIVAFFVPEAPTEAGQRLDLAYRLAWSVADPASVAARVVALRLGRPRRNARPADGRPPRLERKVVLDYAGGALPGSDPAEATVDVALSNGSAHAVRASRSVDRPDGWRVVFDAFSESDDPAEVRVELRSAGRPMAETLVFRFSPPDGLPSGA